MSRPDAVGRSAQATAAEQVVNVLGVLDRTDRAALELIYWQGMTQTQVARELDLSPAAVRHSVARGMHQLAEHLTSPGSDCRS